MEYPAGERARRFAFAIGFLHLFRCLSPVYETRRETEMYASRIGDYVPMQETYFPDAEFLTLKKAKDTDYQLMDFQLFENEKGPGVAIQMDDALGSYKIITHSAPITNLFKEHGGSIREALENGETMGICVRSKVSKKTGKEYFYIE